MHRRMTNRTAHVVTRLTAGFRIPPIAALALVLALVLTLAIGASARAGETGPSFDCARVTSWVARTICASPRLSALDRRLAADYDAIAHQGGIDAKALRAEEGRWLRDVRGQCQDEACLAAAYEARDAALLDTSRRTASPAAYDDTRPFPVPAAVEAAARARIGGPCGPAPAAPLPDMAKIPGFLTVIVRGAYAMPLSFQGARFVWLLTAPEAGECRVAAATALPPAAKGQSFLRCVLEASDALGFGIRDASGDTVAVWSIDAAAGTLTREPIHVLGEGSARCQRPESGE